MLKALSRQLHLLAKDSQDSFSANIRKRVGARDAVQFTEPLRRMILAMPNMISQIHSWSLESGQPWKIRKLHSFALAYLYNPTDFLPEKSFGLFGYLDDAYLVASVFQRTMEEIPDAGLRPLAENGLLWKNIPEWLEATRRLIPDEAAQIEGMLDRAVGLESTKFPVRNRISRSSASLATVFR